MRRGGFERVLALTIFCCACYDSGSGSDGGLDVAADPVLDEGRGEPHPFDDPSVISTPHMIPMFACARSVGADNFVLGATVEFRRLGPGPMDEPMVFTTTAESVDIVTLELETPVARGQSWQVRQGIDGAFSEWSEAEHPSDHREGSPDGLPEPQLIGLNVLACGRAVAVQHVPGAMISVSTGDDVVMVPGGPAFFTNVVMNDPLIEGQQLVVTQTLCEDEAVSSFPYLVRAPPDRLRDIVLLPPTLYEGQEVLLIGGLRAGSTLELTSSIEGPFADTAPWVLLHRDVSFGSSLGRGLRQGEVIEVTEHMESCAIDGPPLVSMPAAPCLELENADVAERSLAAGSTFVLTEASLHPGARLHVWSDSEEIGDNGNGVVGLTRPLVEGETIRVMTQVGSCFASSPREYVVGPCGEAPLPKCP